jgi:hypothetical protein
MKTIQSLRGQHVIVVWTPSRLSKHLGFQTKKRVTVICRANRAKSLNKKFSNGTVVEDECHTSQTMGFESYELSSNSLRIALSGARRIAMTATTSGGPSGLDTTLAKHGMTRDLDRTFILVLSSYRPELQYIVLNASNLLTVQAARTNNEVLSHLVLPSVNKVHRHAVMNGG